VIRRLPRMAGIGQVDDIVSKMPMRRHGHEIMKKPSGGAQPFSPRTSPSRPFPAGCRR
jgi:hypothetical protein